VASFWDTSAIIPLLVQEPATTLLLMLLRGDEHMIVWWGARIECVSALARCGRDGRLVQRGDQQARDAPNLLATSWSEVLPSDRVRLLAERLVSVHPLRAADALQLASALVWSDGGPDQRAFVCLDARLREAARKEGLTVEPLD
jgi:predicted nucleic acid-binding protein